MCIQPTAVDKQTEMHIVNCRQIYMLNLYACLSSLNTSTFISVTDSILQRQNFSEPINPLFPFQEPKKKGKKKGKA